VILQAGAKETRASRVSTSAERNRPHDGLNDQASGTPIRMEESRSVPKRFSAKTGSAASLQESKGGEMQMTLRDWFTILRAHAQRQEGQTMAEYAVVLTLITLGVVAVITTLGGNIATKLGAVASDL
jgi:Flp pilus assembly pilin Flp